MADLKLNDQGDLELIKLTGNSTTIPEQIIGNEVLYEVTASYNYLTDLIKRALQTPIGNISIYTMTDGNLSIVDDLYGNFIYQELSEGLTINLISKIRVHIIEALKRANLTNKVNSVEVSILDSQTIQIFVSYTGNTPSTLIPITF
jgi:hypothetical protein